MSLRFVTLPALVTLVTACASVESDDDGTDAPAAVDAAPDAPPADGAGSPDAPVAADAPVASDGAPADAAPPTWSHTITIDGLNDFTTASERFDTTSTPSYLAYVTWDATHLYLAYEGPDIASGSSTRWVLAYLDIDPVTGDGATLGVQYASQRPSFPAGFRPEYHLQWKADNAFQRLLHHDGGGTWSDTGVVPTTYQTGTFVELAVPFADLGDPTVLGVTAYLLNEAAGGEWSYAGLYTGSFADGYYEVSTAGPMPLGYYLEVDRSSPSAPNDLANRAP